MKLTYLYYWGQLQYTVTLVLKNNFKETNHK